MKTVKYRCKKCGYSENNKKIDYVKYYFLRIASIIGIFMIFILIVSANIGNMTWHLDLTNSFLSNSFTDFAKKHDLELREIAVNFTYPCEGDQVDCYAKKLYIELKDLRYIPNSKYKILYEPLYVLDTGGDCKNTAILYTSLLRSLGLDSYVNCNLKYKHCVSKVPLKGVYDYDYNQSFFVDLSNRIFIKMNNTDEFWEYYDSLTKQ